MGVKSDEESPSLVPQMEQARVTPTGLRLIDGELVLELARGRKSMQVCLAGMGHAYATTHD